MLAAFQMSFRSPKKNSPLISRKSILFLTSISIFIAICNIYNGCNCQAQTTTGHAPDLADTLVDKVISTSLNSSNLNSASLNSDNQNKANRSESSPTESLSEATASDVEKKNEPIQPGIRKIFDIPAELTPDGRKRMFDTLAQLNPEPKSDGSEPSTAPFCRNASPERAYNLVARLLAPSLVHIETTSSRSRTAPASPTGYSVELNNESGAGFIIAHQDRFYVVTNAHVIRAGLNGTNSSGVSLYLYDGKKINPKRIWRDSASDIAVLEIEGLFWPVRWGRGDSVNTGDLILALGSPFGLRNSCSSGIVSAVGRRNLEVGRTDKQLQDYIQTDASIHPGNSGGPLVNLRGEVIGMNSAIASNSGFGEGVSFAIPDRLVLWVVDQLIATGKVQRGTIGASFEKNYTVHLAVQMGLYDALGMKLLPTLPARTGAMVGEITPDSPAARAMLRSGDIILFYDDSVVENADHLQYLINTTPVGKKTPIAFYRSGKLFEHTITIQAAP